MLTAMGLKAGHTIGRVLRKATESFKVAWAILLDDAEGRRVGAIYLTEKDLCAESSNRLYDVDPSLVTYLRRTFSFMDY